MTQENRPSNPPSQKDLSPRADTSASRQAYYQPRTDPYVVTRRMRGLLNDSMEISNGELFEAIADSFAVFNGAVFDKAVSEAEESFFEHPSLGEVDFSYYRYLSGPDDKGEIEDAFVHVGSLELVLYRDMQGNVSVKKMEGMDENAYEPKQEEKKEILRALIDATTTTPNNP